MKKVSLVVAVVIVVVVAASMLDVFAPAASKTYRSYRQAVLEQEGFSKELVASKKGSVEVDECTVSGDTATVRATQKTAVIPPNAASFAFATIVTTRFEATLEKAAGGWKVVEEKELSRDVSTYEDRKNR